MITIFNDNNSFSIFSWLKIKKFLWLECFIPMEFNQWIQYAEDNNLLLTEQTFKKLKRGVPYDVVEIDYLRFLAIEYGDRYNIKFNEIYDPIDLYSRIKETIVPNGRYFMRKSPVLGKDCCQVHDENVKYFEVVLVPSSFEKSLAENNKRGSKGGYSPPYEMGLYKTRDSRWLASGSGDGYSRYILWENLKKMPKVYIDQPNGLKV